MRLHSNREDLSRFLVHLTRDYNDRKAKDNLVGILRDRTIFARNAHCLVSQKLSRMEFNPQLQKSFNTVCFTETPLTQIKQITKPVRGRKIQLKPYGLIFWKAELFDKGASPAIYINAKGTPISEFLLSEFNCIFKDIKTVRELKKAEKEHYQSIIHYFSLINVVKQDHDFLWEREWRYHGDLEFEYSDIVAIIAQNPKEFEKLYMSQLDDEQKEDVWKIPVINPQWTYEELIEELAITTWDKLQDLLQT